MEIKIMLAAAMFLGGFLWVYFLIRQLLFNLRVAYPLLKKMNASQETARHLTAVIPCPVQHGQWGRCLHRLPVFL